MTDRIAFGLGSIVVVALGADMILGTGAVLFLLRRLDSLVEFLAFWR